MAAAVGGTLVPVVTYVVEDIHLTYRHVVAVHAATHRPVTALTVHEQIMAVCAHVAVNGGSIAVVGAGRVVLMVGNTQCLGNHRVLEGKVLRTA